MRYGVVTSVSNNTFVNVGGRAPGNVAGVLIVSNLDLQDNKTQVYVDNNVWYNTWETLFDKSVGISPGYYASFLIRGYRGGIICVYGFFIANWVVVVMC